MGVSLDGGCSVMATRRPTGALAVPQDENRDDERAVRKEEELRDPDNSFFTLTNPNRGEKGDASQWKFLIQASARCLYGACTGAICVTSGLVTTKKAEWRSTRQPANQKQSFGVRRNSAQRAQQSTTNSSIHPSTFKKPHARYWYRGLLFGSNRILYFETLKIRFAGPTISESLQLAKPASFPPARRTWTPPHHPSFPWRVHLQPPKPRARQLPFPLPRESTGTVLKFRAPGSVSLFRPQVCRVSTNGFGKSGGSTCQNREIDASEGS